MDVEFEDIVIAIAIVAVIVGLGLIYLPLALLLPGGDRLGSVEAMGRGEAEVKHGT